MQLGGRDASPLRAPLLWPIAAWGAHPMRRLCYAADSASIGWPSAASCDTPPAFGFYGRTTCDCLGAKAGDAMGMLGRPGKLPPSPSLA